MTTTAKAPATYESWRKEREDRVRAWFTQHKAAHFTGEIGGLEVERLSWKRPDTGMYSIHYVCYGGTLVVTGDLYTAMYQAGATGLAFWAGCDEQYFASKCVSSPEGRGFERWDAEYARIAIRDYCDDERERQGFRQRQGVRALDGQADWSMWLNEHGHDVFGDGWYEMGEVGKVIDQLCLAHLIGLKMAMKSLRAALSATEAGR